MRHRHTQTSVQETRIKFFAHSPQKQDTASHGWMLVRVGVGLGYWSLGSGSVVRSGSVVGWWLGSGSVVGCVVGCDVATHFDYRAYLDLLRVLL